MTAIDVYNSWMNDPCIDAETKAELAAIKNNEKEIEDRFYQELEFGTAGLRGVLGAGTNRMNKYTVCKATQGLADYINSFFDEGENAAELKALPGKQNAPERAAAIAYDSRHMSKEFSDFAAACLNANGIKTYVFESLRPTPELSFAIRELNCISGINITASHNPAEYNGYKAYWADGAQVTPPYDEGIMNCVNAITNLSSPRLMDKDEAVKKGLYVQIGKDVDEIYMSTILKQIRNPEMVKEAGEDVKIVYTPLHGTGIKIVPEVLRRAGIKNIYIVGEQAEPDGDFPTTPYPNPEMPQTFELAEKLGYQVGADICIATDPDADRIGIHAMGSDGKFHELSGNVIGCLICEYELGRLSENGTLPENSEVVRSIVSSKLIDVIAKNYNVKVKEVLTGFKWIGKEILDIEKRKHGHFVFGYEESYGYLVGTHARDKDACVTALVLAEICAYYKTQGIKLWDAVGMMYEKYGYSIEQTLSITKKGVDGMKEIAEDMEKLRNNMPNEIGGMQVKKVVDYNNPKETKLPKSNVLYFVLDDAWVAVRPSGTEPKIKYYFGVIDKNEKAAAEKMEMIKDAMCS